MEFCPDCGKMLMPKKGKIKCRCGYEKSLSEDDIEEQYTMEGETNPEMKVIVTDRDNVALPTTTITCYKCGGTKGYWWTVQTRSADEAPTNFIRCAKCGNTWRSSNQISIFFIRYCINFYIFYFLNILSFLNIKHYLIEFFINFSVICNLFLTFYLVFLLKSLFIYMLVNKSLII